MEKTPKALLQFYKELEEIRPTLPDDVTQHYLQNSGWKCGDKRLIRIISFAAQMFVSGILYDAKQFSRMRKETTPQARLKEAGYNYRDKRVIVTIDDVNEALKEAGIESSSVPYYASSVHKEDQHHQLMG
eukprot:TRINITY_DN16396_c0_g1_i1.p3 TRINITY_DN16396_c0_g1~~TRINITY_DN16396_c0_g1_i1.p3  ORF type:complete len:142 (+),score=15.42 TRINITY_DN16396_c0_g1_i1:38-427(+)